jgi:hypothetical protein
MRKAFHLLAIATLAATVGLLWSGCKGNTAPEAANARPAPSTAILAAAPTATSPLETNPFTDAIWQKQAWQTLTPTLNARVAAGKTQVASTYDHDNLYFAFVCADSETIHTVEGASAVKPWENDSVEVWLDTSAPKNGTEYIRIGTDCTGNLWHTWYRSAVPPKPLEDGRPDDNFPISQIQGQKMANLAARHYAAPSGVAGWAVVIAVPLKELPKPLQVTATAGDRYRVNIIRNDWATLSGRSDLRQSALSPIYENAQAYSPYRMTELRLLEPQ